MRSWSQQRTRKPRMAKDGNGQSSRGTYKIVLCTDIIHTLLGFTALSMSLVSRLVACSLFLKFSGTPEQMKLDVSKTSTFFGRRGFPVLRSY